MIKTILVPTSGSTTDESVFATAHTFARTLAAHLEFFHVRLSVAEAAARAPHVPYCAAAALPQALAVLQRDEVALAAKAAEHVHKFCAAHEIPLLDTPVVSERCTASWKQETDYPFERLMMRARHSDLIVLGRPRHLDYMPVMLIDDLLMGSGRPVVIAPDKRARASLETVVVGWKETAESARALTAAAPLLEKVPKVVLAHIAEGLDTVPASLEHLARQLRWHGIAASVQVVGDVPKHVTSHLAKMVHGMQADALVVGAFGHTRLREMVFGGITQSLLEHADIPIFFMH